MSDTGGIRVGVGHELYSTTEHVDLSSDAVLITIFDTLDRLITFSQRDAQGRFQVQLVQLIYRGATPGITTCYQLGLSSDHHPTPLLQVQKCYCVTVSLTVTLSHSDQLRVRQS